MLPVDHVVASEFKAGNTDHAEELHLLALFAAEGAQATSAYEEQLLGPIARKE